MARRVFFANFSFGTTEDFHAGAFFIFTACPHLRMELVLPYIIMWTTVHHVVYHIVYIVCKQGSLFRSEILTRKFAFGGWKYSVDNDQIHLISGSTEQYILRCDCTVSEQIWMVTLLNCVHIQNSRDR